eukprot:357773-Chlamydomonas_euryale.AAC.10
MQDLLLQAPAGREVMLHAICEARAFLCCAYFTCSVVTARSRCSVFAACEFCKLEGHAGVQPAASPARPSPPPLPLGSISGANRGPFVEHRLSVYADAEHAARPDQLAWLRSRPSDVHQRLRESSDSPDKRLRRPPLRHKALGRALPAGRAHGSATSRPGEERHPRQDAVDAAHKRSQSGQRDAGFALAVAGSDRPSGSAAWLAQRLSPAGCSRAAAVRRCARRSVDGARAAPDASEQLGAGQKRCK